MQSEIKKDQYRIWFEHPVRNSNKRQQKKHDKNSTPMCNSINTSNLILDSAKAFTCVC